MGAHAPTLEVGGGADPLRPWQRVWEEGGLLSLPRPNLHHLPFFKFRRQRNYCTAA